MLFVGILLVACGIFMLVYGGMLFRFAIAVCAFVIGYLVATSLLSGQSQGVQLLAGLVAGGALALVTFSFVRAILHIAGGVLGAIVVLLILSLLPFKMNEFVSLIALIAGAGLIGFFGNRLGDWIIILATTLTGAYAATYGLMTMFPDVFPASSGSALIDFSGPAMGMFVVLFLVGALSQYQMRTVRGRYVNV
jgi:hypothetical protein